MLPECCKKVCHKTCMDKWADQCSLDEKKTLPCPGCGINPIQNPQTVYETNLSMRKSFIKRIKDDVNYHTECPNCGIGVYIQQQNCGNFVCGNCRKSFTNSDITDPGIIEPELYKISDILLNSFIFFLFFSFVGYSHNAGSFETKLVGIVRDHIREDFGGELEYLSRCNHELNCDYKSCLKYGDKLPDRFLDSHCKFNNCCESFSIMCFKSYVLKDEPKAMCNYVDTKVNMNWEPVPIPPPVSIFSGVWLGTMWGILLTFYQLYNLYWITKGQLTWS